MSYLVNTLKKNTDSTPYRAPMPGEHAHQLPYGTHKDGDLNEHPFIPVPDIRQEDNYSCGAASAMAVGKMYGVGPNKLEDWKKLLGTNKQKSTNPEKIVEVLEEMGLQCVEKHGMTKEDLCHHIKAGAPVICCIQEWDDPGIKSQYGYGHYTTVVWVGHGYVFTQDSSIDNVLVKEGSDQSKGKMIIDCETWDADWHDEDLNGKKYDHYGIAVYPPRRE